MNRSEHREAIRKIVRQLKTSKCEGDYGFRHDFTRYGIVVYHVHTSAVHWHRGRFLFLPLPLYRWDSIVKILDSLMDCREIEEQTFPLERGAMWYTDHPINIHESGAVTICWQNERRSP